MIQPFYSLSCFFIFFYFLLLPPQPAFDLSTACHLDLQHLQWARKKGEGEDERGRLKRAVCCPAKAVGGEKAMIRTGEKRMSGVFYAAPVIEGEDEGGRRKGWRNFGKIENRP